MICKLEKGSLVKVGFKAGASLHVKWRIHQTILVFLARVCHLKFHSASRNLMELKTLNPLEELLLASTIPLDLFVKVSEK